MKFLFSLIISLITVSFLTACATQEAMSPQDTAVGFVNALYSGDKDNFLKYIDKSTIPEEYSADNYKKLGSLLNLRKASFNKHGGIEKIEVLKVTEQPNEKVLVDFKVIFNDGMSEIDDVTIVKTPEGWRAGME